MDFLGITRERVYSPGKVEADALILHAVANHLRHAGARVVTCSGDDADWPTPADGTLVFTMAQGPRALERFDDWQGRGVRVVNSPEAIRNCHRYRTVTLLHAADVGLPETVLLATSDATPPPLATGRYWVKRGDVHAVESDDVVACDDTTLTEVVQAFRRRGIDRVAVQRHVDGRVLKFYAARPSFFHCVPPADGSIVPPKVLAHLADIAARGATALGLEVYGGDAVWSDDGRLSLIDLNDWPSYAACRAQGATAIATYFLAQKAEL